MSQAVFSYDKVPYRSFPYAQTHPDRLAVMAQLFGLHAQPIGNARVLEIGCSSGGNLMPMAEMLPGSEFVGVDLSLRQLEEGAQLLNKLSLSNLELLHRDIRDLDQSLGRFHYILVHGVYSWVDQEVQSKLLEVCRENLHPNGVAYVSYNTYPGWGLRGSIRDMLVYHVQGIEDPAEKVARSRALLQFIAQSVPQDDNPYGGFLQQELDIFNRADDSYLFHDHLEGINEPLYFHEFVTRAEQQGLQFLGESHLSVMASNNFGEQVDQKLQEISGDLIQIEQYMDYLRNRSFRQTLLCHREHELDRSLNPEYLKGLYCASRLRADTEPGTQAEESVIFRDGNIKVKAGNPFIIAALTKLQEKCPAWEAYVDLLTHALDHAQKAGIYVVSSEQESLRLGEHLIRCFASLAVDFHSQEPDFVSEVSHHPNCSELMRLQATLGEHITTRTHETATVDWFCRIAMPLLDGSRTVKQVQDAMQTALSGLEPESLQEEARAEWTQILDDPTVADAKLQSSLQQMAECALLIG